MLPKEAANTAPRPMAKGPPMVRNFSLGAQTATVERPPTIPVVYLNIKMILHLEEMKELINILTMQLSAGVGLPRNREEQ